VTGQFSTPQGSRVAGAMRWTSAPRPDSRWTFDRATRECRTSPTMATLAPSRPWPRGPSVTGPEAGTPASARRRVKASSSACVGCSWVPSPALTTGTSGQPVWASRCAVPAPEWRTTMAGAPIAGIVWMVACRRSPFGTEEPAAEKVSTAAESRVAGAAHGDGVGAPRRARLAGVRRALALRQRGALGGEVEHIGREPFGGGFERQAGAGGVLEEEVDHGASAQHGQLLDFAFGHEGHLLGDVEDADGLGPGQRAGVEQMLHSRPPEM